jgi:hypothetical protein
MPNGRLAEDRIEAFAQRPFFSDFIFRSPRYRQGRLEREAGDVVVWFDDALVIIQSKARTLPPERLVLPYSERERAWATKNLTHALNQLRGSRRAFTDARVRALTNERRGEIAFDHSSVDAVHGLVLLDQVIGAYDPAALVPEIRTSAFPVHVFALSEWPLLCSELSTTFDFISYLTFRSKVLHSQPLLVGREADLLAYFILKERDPNAEGPLTQQLEDLGIWFGERFKSELATRNAEDRCSLFIDAVIDRLHDVDDSFSEFVDLPISTERQSYLHVAVELARLNRLERRVLGRKFLERIELAAETQRDRYSVMEGRGGSGYFVLASPHPRVERCRQLAALTALAKHRLGVRVMVGVATEAGFGLGRSYDSVFLDFPCGEDPVADALAIESFSDLVKSSEYEFAVAANR